MTLMRLSPESDTLNCGQASTPDSCPVPRVPWQEHHQKNIEEPGPQDVVKGNSGVQQEDTGGPVGLTALPGIWSRPLSAPVLYRQQELESKL